MFLISKFKFSIIHFVNIATKMCLTIFCNLSSFFTVFKNLIPCNSLSHETILIWVSRGSISNHQRYSPTYHHLTIFLPKMKGCVKVRPILKLSHKWKNFPQMKKKNKKKPQNFCGKMYQKHALTVLQFFFFVVDTCLFLLRTN